MTLYLFPPKEIILPIALDFSNIFLDFFTDNNYMFSLFNFIYCKISSISYLYPAVSK